MTLNTENKISLRPYVSHFVIHDSPCQFCPFITNRDITLPTLHHSCQIRKKRVSIDVFKSLNDSCPPLLRNMFERFDHGKETRGNGSRLVLPKVKTEAGRKTFAFQGALIFNGLPTDLMNEPYFINFKRKIDTLSFVWKSCNILVFKILRCQNFFKQDPYW